MKIILALLLLLPTCATAAPLPEDKYLTHCHLTPSLAMHGYPGHDSIVPSNKLALPAGKSALPDGELVSLSGRVLDENCVPVSDAVVDIWQTNPAGSYVAWSLGERLNPYPYFTGSGRAVTDNLGRFNFVTLFPGPYTVTIRDNHGRILRTEYHAPHINIHVIHDHFATLDTEMFFSGDKRNFDDVDLAKIPQDTWAGLMANVWPRQDSKPESGLYSRWDITLQGSQWRHF